jgi:hypothetical protein
MKPRQKCEKHIDYVKKNDNKCADLHRDSKNLGVMRKNVGTSSENAVKVFIVMRKTAK